MAQHDSLSVGVMATIYPCHLRGGTNADMNDKLCNVERHLRPLLLKVAMHTQYGLFRHSLQTSLPTVSQLTRFQ